MACTGLQYGGFVIGIIGIGLVFAATVMDNWCVKDRQGDMMNSGYSYKGLWRNCDVSNTGFTECRSLHGLVGFSGHFQVVRALMIMAIVISAIAVLVSLFSLKCVKRKSMKLSTKAKLLLSAGVMLIIAGLCGISGPSVFANDIVASFMMNTQQQNPNQGKMGGINQYGEEIGKGGMGMGGMGMGGMGMGGMGMGGNGMGGNGMGGNGMGGNGMGGTGMGGTGMGGTGMGGMDLLAPSCFSTVRYTFGPALFVAWVGGALLILGGILMCVAFKGMQSGDDKQKGYVYKAPGHCRQADEEAEPERPKACRSQKY